MIYLANLNTPAAVQAGRDGLLGQMVTPAGGRAPQPGVRWALDNGCFSDAWTEDRWLTTLDRWAGTPGCLFAVVPDVVGDSAATDDRWHLYASLVRDRGYPVAYVTQNGCTTVPDDADVIFTGGDDRWKLSAQAQRLVDRDPRWTHMGRVNSLRRLRFAAFHHYDSVDGTHLAYRPDYRLPELLRFLTAAEHPMLFTSRDTPPPTGGG